MTDDLPKQFWSAATLLRRARNRDPTMAIRVLTHVATHATGRLRDRAAALLKETEHGQHTDDREAGIDGGGGSAA